MHFVKLDNYDFIVYTNINLNYILELDVNIVEPVVSDKDLIGLSVENVCPQSNFNYFTQNKRRRRKIHHSFGLNSSDHCSIPRNENSHLGEDKLMEKTNQGFDLVKTQVCFIYLLLFFKLFN